MTLSSELFTRQMMSFKWKVHSVHTMSSKWKPCRPCFCWIKMYLSEIKFCKSYALALKSLLSSRNEFGE